jgi:hypothetical protein
MPLVLGLCLCEPFPITFQRFIQGQRTGIGDRGRDTRACFVSASSEKLVKEPRAEKPALVVEVASPFHLPGKDGRQDGGQVEGERSGRSLFLFFSSRKIVLRNLFNLLIKL